MTLISDHDHAGQPEPATIPAPEQQIGVAIADTPQGQRLAITITCLLPPEQARQLAAAITQAAASMSATGLTAAPSGLLIPGR